MKNKPQPFVIMDRVPVYLEIDASQLQFPSKIFVRPNIEVEPFYNEAAVNLIQSKIKVFISTKTKNPCERYNQ